MWMRACNIEQDAVVQYMLALSFDKEKKREREKKKGL